MAKSNTKTLDDGWVLEEVKRSTGAIDRYWYSPLTSKKFRSRIELSLFKAILKEVGESNEEEAWKIFQAARGKKEIYFKKYNMELPNKKCHKSKNDTPSSKSMKSSLSTNEQSSNRTPQKRPRKERQKKMSEAKQSETNKTNTDYGDNSIKIRKQCAAALVKAFEKSELDATLKQLSPTNAYMFDISEPKLSENTITKVKKKARKPTDSNWMERYKQAIIHSNSEKGKGSLKKSGTETVMPEIAESKCL